MYYKYNCKYIRNYIQLTDIIYMYDDNDKKYAYYIHKITLYKRKDKNNYCLFFFFFLIKNK